MAIDSNLQIERSCGTEYACAFTVLLITSSQSWWYEQLWTDKEETHIKRLHYQLLFSPTTIDTSNGMTKARSLHDMSIENNPEWPWAWHSLLVCNMLLWSELCCVMYSISPPTDVSGLVFCFSTWKFVWFHPAYWVGLSNSEPLYHMTTIYGFCQPSLASHSISFRH